MKDKDFTGGVSGKEPACNTKDLGLIPGWRRPLGEGMATHSSILAWRIPWTEEPGGPQSMRLQRLSTACMQAVLRLRLPTQRVWVRSLGGEDPLEKGTATHSHILSWRIPWTEEPGGL